MLAENLLPFWNNKAERCGYITLDNGFFELENIHETPREGFEIAAIPKEAVALWHTHPSGCPNLSVEDFHLFKSLPHLLHIIVGQTELAYYFVDTDGTLLRRNDE